MSALHAEAAPKMLQLVLELGGYYIKMGQTVVGMGTMLPKEYDDVFSILLDDCPTLPWEEIEQIIKEELKVGDPLNFELCSCFSHWLL